MEYLFELFRDLRLSQRAVPAVCAWGPRPLPEDLPPGTVLDGARPSQVCTFALDDGLTGRIITGGTPEACDTVWCAMQEAGHDLADELQARGLTLHAPCRDPGLVWAMAVFTAAGRGMLGARGLVGDDAYRQLIEDDTGKLGLLCGERFLRWRRIGEDRVGTTRYATIEDLVGSSMALLRVLREPSVGADGGATREELPAEAREEDASEPTTLAKIESMRDTDAGKLLLYTVGELGDRLGVDKSTISRALSVSGDAGDARRKYAMYRRERKRITDRMRKGRAISEADEKMLTRLGHLEGVAKWTCARCRAV